MDYYFHHKHMERLNSVRILCKFQFFYLSIFVGEVNAESAHGSYYGNQRLSRVAVNDRLELLVVLACESALMDDSVSISIIIIIIIIIYHAPGAVIRPCKFGPDQDSRVQKP